MTGYQFHGQLPDEDVVLFTRQHPFVLFHAALWTALVAAVPVLVWVVASTGPIVALSVPIGAGIALCIALLAWYRWRNTVFMLTTQRVIFLEQRGLFTREMAECPLDSVQQVSHRVKGILATVAGFGTLSVATSGSVQAMDVGGLPDPYEIQEEITAAKRGEGSEYAR